MYVRLLTSDGKFVAKFRLDPSEPFHSTPFVILWESRAFVYVMQRDCHEYREIDSYKIKEEEPTKEDGQPLQDLEPEEDSDSGGDQSRIYRERENPPPRRRR